MFLALGFVMMVSGFHAESDEERKVPANTALVLSGVYAVLILLVYYAQVTSVRLDPLGEDASNILDYERYGLFFNYDLLGYGIMSLLTFFIGLAIKPKNRQDKWLKGLLMIHGVFFIFCFVLPMLGIFKSGTDDLIGTVILEVWCIYFLPVCMLSHAHFARMDKEVVS